MREELTTQSERSIEIPQLSDYTRNRILKISKWSFDGALNEVINCVPIGGDTLIPNYARYEIPKAPKTKQTEVIRRLTLISDKAIDVINKLPFGGKTLLTPLMIDTFKERNTHSKEIKIVKASAILGSFVLIHAFQGLLGVYALDHLLSTSGVENPMDAFKSLVDVTYLSANFAVTIAQMRLLSKVGSKFIETRHSLKHQKEIWKYNNKEDNSEIIAKRLVYAISKKDRSALTTFFLVNSKRDRQDIIAKASEMLFHGELHTDRSDLSSRLLYTLSKFKVVDEGTSKTTILTNTFLRSIFSSDRPESFFTTRETIKMALVTWGGQILFLIYGWH